MPKVRRYYLIFPVDGSHGPRDKHLSFVDARRDALTRGEGTRVHRWNVKGTIQECTAEDRWYVHNHEFIKDHR